MSVARVFKGRRVETVAFADARPGESDDELVWLDVDDSRDAEQAAEVLGISPELLRPDSARAPQVIDRGEFVDLSLEAPDGDGEVTSVRCLAARVWLVTVRDKPIEALETLAADAEGKAATGALDGFAFVATLAEWILGSYEDAFNRVEEALEKLDLETMRTDRSPELSDERLRSLVGLRARVGALRRSLVSHRGVVVALSHPEIARLDTDEAADRVQALQERFRDTLDASRDARESVFNSFDVVLAITGQRTNDIVRLLTIASFVFLPGSLCAGILGMNFPVGLFKIEWLFWVAVGGIAAFIATVLIVARARRWL